MELITSRRNPLVTRFRRAARRTAGDDPTVLLEGPRLVEDALAAGVRVHLAAVRTGPAGRRAETAAGRPAPDARGGRRQTKATPLLDRLAPDARVVRVTAAVMDALSPVSTPSGLVALAKLRPARIDDVMQAPRPLVVGLGGVQDPGNTGAVIRAVEAGGASGVVAVGGADPFGWKALRGAMGSAFRLPIARGGDPAEVRRQAAARGLRVIAAVPHAGTPLTETDLTGPCLVWLGAEGSGVDPDAVEAADDVVSIPMRRPVESLNVAVAAALVVYEAARQRGAPPPS